MQPTLMSLDEYLHTSFENPDPEFLEGEVIERNGGTLSHSAAMGELAYRLAGEEARTGFSVVLSIRLRTGENRVRVADVAAFLPEPDEQVPSTPPMIVIEITSPEDRFCFLVQKLDEYRRWGVKHIWVADPDDRKFFTYGDAGWNEVTDLNLPEYGIVLTKADIFEAA
ncbi:MAG TPA: Uma2 family endonuclease [Bryobacteraceae bacterium]|nr:Uma2 family endonuclease [Bryobacteraceae bacterium]